MEFKNYETRWLCPSCRRLHRRPSDHGGRCSCFYTARYRTLDCFRWNSSLIPPSLPCSAVSFGKRTVNRVCGNSRHHTSRSRKKVEEKFGKRPQFTVVVPPMLSLPPRSWSKTTGKQCSHGGHVTDNRDQQTIST